VGETTRVLVVDDSELATLALIELLAIDPTISVVGTAQSGREAIELTARLRPDLIMMDVNMPALSGIDASEQIMSQCPTPILLITANYDSSAGSVAFRALQCGALDVVEKPQGGPGTERQARALADHVKLLAGVPVIRHLRAGLRAAYATARAETPLPPLDRGGRRLVAIAASTGGPAAIATVLAGLPGDFPAPVLVVQHIIPAFTAGFVSWLAAISATAIAWSQAWCWSPRTAHT
jgi:two-component system chemotaxis response regulator CheB